MVVAMTALFVVANEQLTQRLDVEFEGRDFYPRGLALVPESLPARYFAGWLFNFLVPFPFIPSRAADGGYFAHLLIFHALWFVSWRRMRASGRRLGAPGFGLLLCALFFFAFVLTTTPGAGPLVRYRLFAELLFLIALSSRSVPASVPASAGRGLPVQLLR